MVDRVAGTPVMQHWDNHHTEGVISYVQSKARLSYTYPLPGGRFCRVTQRDVVATRVLAGPELDLYEALAMLQSVDTFEGLGKLDRAWAMLLESYKAGSNVLGGPKPICELMDVFHSQWGKRYERLAPLMR